MKKIRLSLLVSPAVDNFLEEVSRSEGITKAEVFRRALALLKAARQQKELGRPYMGFVADQSKLDAVIIYD